MTKEYKDNQIVKHNERIWDIQAENQCAWSQPVSSDQINLAKTGDWSIHITKKPLPTDWLPTEINNKKILCLASAGGQQAPILSAAGACVTVFDISEKQLDQDDFVAKRDGLKLRTIQGDMRDLSALDENTFDYIIHPISNLYIPNLDQLWEECYRVLKKGGVLLASFYNPILFVFRRDEELSKKGLLEPKYKLPYSDENSLNQREFSAKLESSDAIAYGHTLTEQIEKQIKAGFFITGFYEDDHPSPRFLIEKYMQTMIATRALKS